MALARVGTITEIVTSGSGTAVHTGTAPAPGAGSNRLFIARVGQKGLGTAFTNLVYNSVTRTPAVSITDLATSDRTSAAIFIFKESELAAGTSAFTLNFGSNGFDVSVFWEVISGADQTTGYRSGTPASAQGLTSSGLTSSVAQTLVVGDYQLAIAALRNAAGGQCAVLNSFTEDFDLNSTGGNGGAFVGGFLEAVGTSSPVQMQDNSGAGDASYSLVALAIAPFVAGVTPVGSPWQLQGAMGVMVSM